VRITAAVTHELGQPFVLEELDLDEPRADEVLVRLVATGICHTDLFSRDHWPGALPAVFGHEGAGVVERVGTAVTRVRPGDHVVLTFASCGQCPSCVRGRPSYCRHNYAYSFTGARLDGSTTLRRNGTPVASSYFSQSSFATHALATERNAIKVRTDVPLELLGPLGCGIQTGAGAILNSLHPEAGSSVVVFGVGSVGLSAIMGAVVAGCETIIAVDTKPRRLELARELGATHALPAGGDAVLAGIRELTGGGAGYALDTTGQHGVIRQAVEALAPLGVFGLIGGSASGPDLTLPYYGLLFTGKSVRGIAEGDSNPEVFIPHLIELYTQGRFPFDRLVTYYPFAQINEAATASEAGTATKPILRFDSM
jgi:aryl-alcohol dehydrogenase